MGPSPLLKDVTVAVGDFTGKIMLMVGSTGTVICGRMGLVTLDIRLAHGGSLMIGDKTTVNNARIIVVNSTVLIKQDAMLSDEILIQGFDRHGIIDLASGNFINLGKDSVVVGKHAWIGRRVTLMPGSVIGNGAIVGACAVVTTEVPDCTVAAGVPARILRENVSWSRSWTSIDPDALQFLQEIDAPFLRES